MVAYNFIFICLHIRDLSNNALSSTVQGMNGAFTGLQKLIMLWVLCLSCWMCYCNKVILIFWTKNKRFKLTWYRYFLFIFFFTLKISSNFWLCKACHIYNFLKWYSGIKSTKHYCTHPVDMAKTSIQLLLWLSFCVMSSLHFTGSICDLLRIRNLRQLDIMCCAFLLCKFPWEIENGLIKFFFRRLDGNRVTWIAANAFSGLKAMQSLWVHFLSQINISNLCWKIFQTCPRYLKLEKRRQWKRLARSTHIYQGWKNYYMYVYSPISTDQASSFVVSMQRFL